MALTGVGLSAVIPEVSPSMRFMFTDVTTRAGVAHSCVYYGSPGPRASEIAAGGHEPKAAGRGAWGPPCFGEKVFVRRSQLRVGRRHKV